ncbi:MAG: hypothetical protein APU95_02345 [Hadesarchaea archaeon YNP_N21]|nr:MAG: hypothetical protein APU95_02345 [Hadesarchaea archaeon YNP_N21]
MKNEIDCIDNLGKTRTELLKLNLRLGFKNVLTGVDYYRMIEYPIAATLLNLKKRHKVLDIGSLVSIFPLYLGSKGVYVYAIDINEKVKKLEVHAKKLGINLKTTILDATNLHYPDNSFDRVTAISTIEHILPIENGDIKAMKEIGRVLKDGGLAVITVPYGKGFSVERRVPFMARRYNKETIYSRLIEPSGLFPLKIFYFCDDFGFGKIWYKLLIFMFNPVSFIFSNIFLRVRLVDKNAKGAIVLLQKR